MKMKSARAWAKEMAEDGGLNVKVLEKKIKEIQNDVLNSSKQIDPLPSDCMTIFRHPWRFQYLPDEEL